MNPAEPAASSDLPRLPRWITLSPSAARAFRILRARLEGIGLASASDTEKLTLAALRLAEVAELDAVLTREGSFYTVEATGLVKSHPAARQRSEAMKHLQSLLGDFGLDPVNRSKVRAPAAGKPDDKWAVLVKEMNGAR